MSLALSGYAQRELATLQLESKARDIQFVNCGDSVFVFYNTPYYIENAQHLRSKTFLIKPDGSIDELKTSFKTGGSIAAVIYKNNKYCFYVFEGKGKSIALRSIYFDNLNNFDKPLKVVETEFSGDFLGALREKNSLFCYTYSKQKLLIEWEINASGEIKKDHFKVPIDLSDFYDKRTKIKIQHSSSIPDLFSGISKFRIFRYGDKNVITIDCREGCNGLVKVTKIITIMRNGSPAKYQEFSTMKPLFVSAFEDEKLFRFLRKGREYELEVLDAVTGKQMSNHIILKENVSDEDTVYLNNGKQHIFHNNAKLKTLMTVAGGGLLSINVFRKNESEYILNCGAFQEIPSAGQILLPALTGNIAAGLFVGNLLDRLTILPGNLYYFNLNYNSRTKEFQKTESITTAYHQIEKYEFNLSSNVIKIKDVAYFPGDNKIIGVYHLPKNNQIKIMAFEN